MSSDESLAQLNRALDRLRLELPADDALASADEPFSAPAADARITAAGTPTSLTPPPTLTPPVSKSPPQPAVDPELGAATTTATPRAADPAAAPTAQPAVPPVSTDAMSQAAAPASVVSTSPEPPAPSTPARRSTDVAPVVRDAVAPEAPDAAAPPARESVAPVAAAPLARDAVAPVAPDADAPLAHDTVAPVAPDAAAPLAQDDVAPVGPDAVAPVAPAPSVPRLPSAVDALAAVSTPSVAASDEQSRSTARVAERPILEPRRRRSRRISAGAVRALVGRAVRTAFIAVLIAGVGVGARFGYDQYERRTSDDTATADGTGTSGYLPPLDAGLPTAAALPVSGKYVDLTTAVDGAPDDPVAYTIRWRYSLASDNLTAEYEDDTFSYELDVRDDRVSVRPSGQGSWIDASDDAGITAIPGDLVPFRGLVPLFHDVVPAAAVPFTKVVAETDEQLDLVPLDPQPVVSEDADAPDAAEVLESLLDEPVDATIPDVVDLGVQEAGDRPAVPVDVRHYELLIDVPAFADAAPIAHAEWSKSLWSDGVLELWVDELGVVRQFAFVDGPTTVTVTINDVADQLDNFQTQPIVVDPFAELQGP